MGSCLGEVLWSTKKNILAIAGNTDTCSNPNPCLVVEHAHAEVESKIRTDLRVVVHLQPLPERPAHKFSG